MKLRNFGYAAVLAVTAAAFVIGSAVPSDAKAKKKKAEAAPPPATCWLTTDKAVCATKGGLKFTYKNSCYAAKDGAKVVSDKACPAKKAVKAGKKKGGKKAAKPDKKK
jgi:hypothetical protein